MRNTYNPFSPCLVEAIANSPININPVMAVKDADMPVLTFNNHDIGFPQNITIIMDLQVNY